MGTVSPVEEKTHFPEANVTNLLTAMGSVTILGEIITFGKNILANLPI
jgi:hypothetical protein